MTTLIFSCSTGEGHNSAARAIKSVYDLHGKDSAVVDALSVFPEKAEKLICSGHTALYRHMPKLFGAGYRYCERRMEKENSVIYDILAKGSRSLDRLIRQNQCDTVVSTHPFSGLMLAKIKRDIDSRFSIGFVSTDYTCAPFVNHCGADLYFIPHESLTGEFVSNGVPEDRIIPSGIPVSNKFRMGVSKVEARRELGLPEYGDVCLLMCGSMGCGPIRSLALELGEKLRRGQTLVVICGTNKKLMRQLSEENTKDNVKIVGFTQKMPLYMAAADLALTKGGGLTLTEGANSRLPMAVIDAVSGCESHNVEFFTKNGLAVRTPDVRDTADFIIRLLKDGRKLEEMSARLAAFFPGNAGEIVYGRMSGNGTALDDRLQKISAVKA